MRLFGAIADDYTGASDLAGMLSVQGVRTLLLLGVEAAERAEADEWTHEAVVVALKTRSVPPDEACEQSLRALSALRRLGVRQTQFKYSSTFDSTAKGNIGPVIDALMEAMAVPFTIAVPALPVNGRTQYEGYLFVHGRPLAETHMRHHPVTPMKDSNVVRHLRSQMRRRVGLIPFDVVRRGPQAIRTETDRLRKDGIAVALVDVLNDTDLTAVAEAAADLPLITGGSGLAMKLPAAWRKRGDLSVRPNASYPVQEGAVLMLSGSCSDATLEQLDVLRTAEGDYLTIDVLKLLGDADAVIERLFVALSSAISDQGWVMVSSSARHDDRLRILDEAHRRGLTATDVQAAVESVHQQLATRAVESGLVRHLVVAGGETSGAVARALGLQALEIQAPLDPGVPVMRSLRKHISVVFKSGNFGSPSFFLKALRHFHAIPV